MTVAHWVAAVIILVLVVGLGCYVAGWVHRDNCAHTYAVEQRRAQSFLPVDDLKSSMVVNPAHIPAGPIPTVVNVYVIAPSQLAQCHGWPQDRALEGAVIEVIESEPSYRGELHD